MKTKTYLTMTAVTLLSANVHCADWDDFPIPASVPEGMQWQLTDMSDEFDYTAPADGKSEEFCSRWTEGSSTVGAVQV